jgi:hypothetical protein
VLTFGIIKERIMIDAELARELIVLKAKDLGLDDNELVQLDEVVCKMLGIENSDPLIFPA